MREKAAKEQWWPKVCGVKFSIAITGVFCILHIEKQNLRERVARRCACPKICDMKILTAKTCSFRIVNIQILNTREREYREGWGGLGFLLKKFL